MNCPFLQVVCAVQACRWLPRPLNVLLGQLLQRRRAVRLFGEICSPTLQVGWVLQPVSRWFDLSW